MNKVVNAFTAVGIVGALCGVLLLVGLLSLLGEAAVGILTAILIMAAPLLILGGAIYLVYQFLDGGK